MYKVLLGKHADYIFREAQYPPKHFVTTCCTRGVEEVRFPSLLSFVLIQHFNFLQKLAVAEEVTSDRYFGGPLERQLGDRSFHSKEEVKTVVWEWPPIQEAYHYPDGNFLNSYQYGEMHDCPRALCRKILTFRGNT
jgi:hypothetical protein